MSKWTLPAMKTNHLLFEKCLQVFPVLFPKTSQNYNIQTEKKSEEWADRLKDQVNNPLQVQI